MPVSILPKQRARRTATPEGADRWQEWWCGLDFTPYGKNFSSVLARPETKIIFTGRGPTLLVFLAEAARSTPATEPTCGKVCQRIHSNARVQRPAQDRGIPYRWSLDLPDRGEHPVDSAGAEAPRPKREKWSACRWTRKAERSGVTNARRPAQAARSLTGALGGGSVCIEA